MSISNKALRVEPCDQADPYVSCKISFQDFKRTSCACPELPKQPVFQDLCPEALLTRSKGVVVCNEILRAQALLYV